MNKINSLEASGGTNGGEGLKLAYKVAMKNFNKKSNNRVILATDGDLNIGMTSTEELKNISEVTEGLENKIKDIIYLKKHKKTSSLRKRFYIKGRKIGK